MLIEACSSMETAKEALKELYEERKKDEKRFNRYLGT